MPALWGGIQECWVAVELVNQEWLHWFPVNIHRSWAYGPKWLLAEFAGVGLVMCFIGDVLF